MMQHINAITFAVAFIVLGYFPLRSLLRLSAINLQAALSDERRSVAKIESLESDIRAAKFVNHKLNREVENLVVLGKGLKAENERLSIEAQARNREHTKANERADYWEESYQRAIEEITHRKFEDAKTDPKQMVFERNEQRWVLDEIRRPRENEMIVDVDWRDGYPQPQARRARYDYGDCSSAGDDGVRIILKPAKEVEDAAAQAKSDAAGAPL